MKEIYEVVLALHILGGAIGLLTMLGPLATKKGSRLHRRIGWVFCWAMGLSTVTGVLISSSWITIPTLVKTLPSDPAKLERAVESLRAAGVFFFVLSMLTAHAIASGLVSTRNKRSSPWKHPLIRGLTVALLASAGASLWLGITHVDPLLIGFGALGLLSAYDTQRVQNKSWVRLHLESMLGACTAATTAFAVQIAGRITTSTVAMGLAWSLPVALGIGTTVWWTRRLRQRKIDATS